MNNILLWSLCITEYNPLYIVGYSVNIYMVRLKESKVIGRCHVQVNGRTVVALGRERKTGKKNWFEEAHGKFDFLPVHYLFL